MRQRKPRGVDCQNSKKWQMWVDYEKKIVNQELIEQINKRDGNPCNPNVAKVEDAADARRQWRGCSINYAEPLTTQQMRHDRLSRRVNNRADTKWFLNLTRWGFHVRHFKPAKACFYS